MLFTPYPGFFAIRMSARFVVATLTAHLLFWRCHGDLRPAKIDPMARLAINRGRSMTLSRRQFVLAAAGTFLATGSRQEVFDRQQSGTSRSLHQRR